MLSNKLAFVTGAGSGIGRATCKIMAREGAQIVGADLKKISVDETIKQLPGNHMSMELDVADGNQVLNALNQIKNRYAKLPTVIVNCAGITRDNFLLKMTLEAFQEVIDVNLKGTFLVTQAFCKSLSEAGLSGSIINLASIVGQTGNMGQANYAASKAAVEAFTKTVAKEMGQYGIRCNAVVPGFIESPMTDAVPEKVREMFKSKIPLARLGQPQEIAEVIAFLASEKSSYINGASISVTGGL